MDCPRAVGVFHTLSCATSLSCWLYAEALGIQCFLKCGWGVTLLQLFNLQWSQLCQYRLSFMNKPVRGRIDRHRSVSPLEVHSHRPLQGMSPSDVYYCSKHANPQIPSTYTIPTDPNLWIQKSEKRSTYDTVKIDCKKVLTPTTIH